LEAQKDAEIVDRSILTSAIIHFHQRRQFMLECLRLTLAFSADPGADDNARDVSRELMGLILEIKDGPARNGSLYLRKCLRAMADVETWLQDLGDRIQGSIALGQVLTPENSELMDFEQQSLGQQHESLGAIVNGLVKANYSGVEDFYKLLEHLPQIERWNNLAVHYVPVIIAFTSQYGSPEGSGTLRDARMLNTRILDSKDNAAWKLRNFHAATITWWLAEYSGWYLEQPTGSPVQGVNFEAEALGRSESFFQALKDGALQCTLSICSQITPYEWYDPAKNTLVSFLLRDTPPLPHDLVYSPTWLRTLTMEQFEIFADAFITNMPDTLRRFKSEEDDQRKRIHSSLQTPGRGGASEQDLHLERFLLIISFSFDDHLEAAQSFWGDVDSNLYGFLQWASRRQSTPCVGAFCDMLRSISKTEDCASSAHQFLLEESTSAPAKIRRSSSLSWSQIFRELNLYTSKIREQSNATKPTNMYGGKPNSEDIDEPESVLMLESYLRLSSHLCTESTEARSWVLSQTSPHMIDTLFYLCNGTVPSRLQSCAFSVIRALLTSKSAGTGIAIWGALDQWVCGAYAPSLNLSRTSKIPNAATKSEEATFRAIAGDFEQANAFVDLLQSLLNPALPDTGLNDRLPFPEALGSSYRMPGVDPYVDLVLDKIFADMMPQLEEPLKNRILAYNILSFVVICLGTFNEDLVVLANKSAISVDEAMNTSSLSTYVTLHPFSRVMDWMFNERVLALLFATMHQDVDEVSSSPPDSPVVLNLIRGIEAMNLIMDLQPTYLDIVRPLRKEQLSGRNQSVFNPSLASFEDSVALHLDLIVDLGLYSGIGNQDLAMSSLKLLQKLASSRLLNAQVSPGSGQRIHGNRLIGVVEQHNDLERISRSLRLGLELDPRILEQGPKSADWAIKSVTLEFLVHNLSASPDRPTLAHALLGFACAGAALDVEPESLFAKGLSLFHSIVHLVADYPDGEEGRTQLWALSIRQLGIEVLSILWKSPLTSALVLTELRASDLLFALCLRQQHVDPTSQWDDRSIRDPDFMFTESAESLQQFLLQRCDLLEYAGAELRRVALEGAPSLKARIFSTLLGSTSLPNGQQVPNITIFELLDFMELDMTNRVPSPKANHFAGLDFGVTFGASPGSSHTIHDLRLVEEMIALRFNELRRSGRLQDANEEQQVIAEAEHIVQYLRSVNNECILTLATWKTLTAWTDLLILAIDTNDLDHEAKAALILQALQVVTPKLEIYALNHDPCVTALANLVQALLFQLDFKTSALDRSRAGDVANDRLFQVFRTALRAVSGPEVGMQLREVLYNICYRYLAEMCAVSDIPIRRRHGMHSVKVTGEKTMDIICDDAYNASATCRISALLLLDALAILAKVEASNYIIESMVRTNFLQILVESIEDIPPELRSTHAKGKSLLEPLCVKY